MLPGTVGYENAPYTVGEGRLTRWTSAGEPGAVKKFSLEKLRKYERKKYFDEDIPVDIEEVLDVAAELDIQEFDVFHLAYAWWHGNESTDATIEPFFVRYMFDDVVPHWVRQFTRMALRLKQEGRLNARDFGVEPEPADGRMVAKGIRYGIYLVAALTSLILLAHFTAELVRRCMFPPCY